MVGWRHQFNGHELGQTPGDGEGQGDLVCCSSWGCKESDMIWRLNNSNICVCVCVCMRVCGCVGLTQKFFPFSSKNKRLIFHFHQNLH